MLYMYDTFTQSVCGSAHRHSPESGDVPPAEQDSQRVCI